MNYIIANSGKSLLNKSLVSYQKFLFTKSCIPYRTSYFTRPYFQNQLLNRTCVPINSEKLKKWHQFHTSAPKNALPPLILFFARVVAQIGSVYWARRLRRRWKGLTIEERQQIKHTKILPNKGKITASIAGLIILLISIYGYHLKDNHILKRKQFILFTKEQLDSISKIEEERVSETAKILDPSDRFHKEVLRVLSNILEKNQIENHYTLSIVEDFNNVNAFVTTNRHIFVYTGLLKYCNNEDQLAIILSHEVAHDLLDHIAERISKEAFQHWLYLIPIFAFFSIFPDLAAFALTWIAARASDIAFTLPFSRQLESEADKIGLILAAKACVDIREASALWGKMVLNEPDQNLPEWLSTHPSDETRHLQIEKLIDRGLEVRKLCQCPKIVRPDPRKEINFFLQQKKILEEERLILRERQR